MARLLTVVVVLALLPSLAAAPVITPNTTEDIIDPLDGLCSLREAVIAANTDAESGVIEGECPSGDGPDEILLGQGIYQLTIDGAHEDLGLTGDLDILDDLTITGEGATGTYIAYLPWEGRVLDIPAGPEVTISRVAITGGFFPIAAGYADYADYAGAGIRNSGSLSLSDSVVIDNSSYIGGGGISNEGDIVITRSTITSNSSEIAGGLFSFGNAVLIDVTVEQNWSNHFDTGGIGAGGTMSIEDSTISNNFGYDACGGIAIYGEVRITNTTISGNTAFGVGGGVCNRGGSLTLSNSTVTDNLAYGYYSYPDFIAYGGAGIFTGARWRPGGSNTVIANTIVAGNVLENSYIQNSDCDSTDPESQATSLGYNIFGPGCPSFGPGDQFYFPEDVFTTVLGPLEDNGGITRSHALLPFSPAIDMGHPDGCKDANGDPLLTDQRGVMRPLDGDGNGSPDCDIGTYEFLDADADNFHWPFDCVDTDFTIYPDAPEVCDGRNNDCNHPDWPALTVEADDDLDGLRECDGDCDDTNPDIFPGAPHLCDGANNDCNDPDWPRQSSEQDTDGDGFYTSLHCSALDCNDGDPGSNPDETESCDGFDNDCDGQLDNDTVCDMSCDSPTIWLNESPISETFRGGRGFLRLVWTGSGYGMVWVDDRDGFESVYFVLLDRAGNKTGETLRISDNVPGASPSISWTGSGFGVVWQGQSVPRHIWFTYLDASGKKTMENVSISPTRAYYRDPDIAWNGTEFGLVWTDFYYDGEFWYRSGVYFTTVDKHGKLAPGIRQIASGSRPEILWTGEEYGIPWRGSYETHLTRLNPWGVQLGSQVPLDLRTTSHFVWTGTEYGVVWSAGEIYFARLATDGMRIGQDLQITNTLGFSYPSSLAWNGSEYAVAWYNRHGGTTQSYFTRLDVLGNTLGQDLNLTDELSTSLSGPILTWNGRNYGMVAADNTGIHFAAILCNCQDLELPGNFIDEDCDWDLGSCSPCLPWKNHGEYVRCVDDIVHQLLSSSSITTDQADALMENAAHSDIGKKDYLPPECPWP